MVTRIKTTNVTDGSLLNADVNASAAIAATKVSGLATSATTDTTNAANIGSGILPDARLPATLPAISGENLTGIAAGHRYGHANVTWTQHGSSTSGKSVTFTVSIPNNFTNGGMCYWASVVGGERQTFTSGGVTGTGSGNYVGSGQTGGGNFTGSMGGGWQFTGNAAGATHSVNMTFPNTGGQGYIRAGQATVMIIGPQ